jgi:molecular chaperone DnaK
VGGSTRTPRISQLLEDRLGQPAHQEVNPDLCVAMGAGIQGGIISGLDVGAVLVDITPHTLGIKVLDSGLGVYFPYRFAPIIKRNTPLPATRSELFHTARDQQTEVEIDVYQGDDDDVRHNHRVGRFTVEGLAPVAAGNLIAVQLDLTLDGTLRVSARERATGLQKQVTIENALARFEREERGQAQERLDRLWADQEAFDEEDEILDELEGEDEVPDVVAPAAHPGGQDHSPAHPTSAGGHRETVQARALIEKAERILERLSPEDRADVERQLGRVRDALNDRKWDLLVTASNELADTLFYLEDA